MFRFNPPFAHPLGDSIPSPERNTGLFQRACTFWPHSLLRGHLPPHPSSQTVSHHRTFPLLVVTFPCDLLRGLPLMHYERELRRKTKTNKQKERGSGNIDGSFHLKLAHRVPQQREKTGWGVKLSCFEGIKGPFGWRIVTCVVLGRRGYTADMWHTTGFSIHRQS